MLEALLFDEGLITDMRTAAAGAVIAKYLAPESVKTVGVIGTGIQARLQIEFLREIKDFDRVCVYGRRDESIQHYIQDMTDKGFDVQAVDSVEQLANVSDMIVSTTPSTTPIILREHARPGLHVTALGADGRGKQEVESAFLGVTNINVVDSRKQCFDYSDTSFALKDGTIKDTDVFEIGEIIKNPKLGRQSNDQITFADLTGVAVQDIVAAELILAKLQQ